MIDFGEKRTEPSATKVLPTPLLCKLKVHKAGRNQRIYMSHLLKNKLQLTSTDRDLYFSLSNTNCYIHKHPLTPMQEQEFSTVRSIKRKATVVSTTGACFINLNKELLMRYPKATALSVETTPDTDIYKVVFWNED